MIPFEISLPIISKIFSQALKKFQQRFLQIFCNFFFNIPARINNFLEDNAPAIPSQISLGIAFRHFSWFFHYILPKIFVPTSGEKRMDYSKTSSRVYFRESSWSLFRYCPKKIFRKFSRNVPKIPSEIHPRFFFYFSLFFRNFPRICLRILSKGFIQNLLYCAFLNHSENSPR